MRKRLLGSIAICLGTCGLVLGEEPPAELSWPRIPTSEPKKTVVAPASRADLQKSDDKEKPQEELIPKPPERLEPQADPSPVGALKELSSMSTNPPKVDLLDYHFGPEEQFWVQAEYLLWWTKDGPLNVPLVTTGPSSGADPTIIPSTVVIGNNGLDYGNRSGGRVTVGLWLDGQHITGFEASGFLLEKPSVTFRAQSDVTGNPVLGRPFFAVDLASPPGEPPREPSAAALLVSYPNILSGGVTVTSSSRFWGAEANFVRNAGHHFGWDVNLLFGFRYLNLDEHLLIDQTSQVLDSRAANGQVQALIVAFPAGNELLNFGPKGSTVTISDGFSTQNNFYGAQIGGRVGWRGGIWAVDVQTKVAFGPTHEALNVSGTTQAPGAGINNATGGFLALATNIGHQSTNWFSIVPEVGINLGCQVMPHVRAIAGYNFLYMNSVVRPGNQINLNIHRNFLPTSPALGSPLVAEPSQLFRQDEFWAHGLNFGVLFSF